MMLSRPEPVTVMLASQIKPDYIQQLRETVEVLHRILRIRNRNSLIPVSNLVGSAAAAWLSQHCLAAYW